MSALLIKTFDGYQPYEKIFQAMKDFTMHRTKDTADEIWLMQHEPVFTQGQAGKREHVLNPGKIPIVQSDRGGQVTYHGPGQLMIYTLLDLRRHNLSVRALVTKLEQTTIDLLKGYAIASYAKKDAPGIYTNEGKICSLGLRVKKGCCYHGLCLNVALDLSVFSRINPCGFKNLPVTDIQHYVTDISVTQVSQDASSLFAQVFSLTA